MQVKDLLGQTGTVLSLWMPTIKNLAYVVYQTSDEAESTRYAAQLTHHVELHGTPLRYLQSSEGFRIPVQDSQLYRE